MIKLKLPHREDYESILAEDVKSTLTKNPNVRNVIVPLWRRWFEKQASKLWWLSFPLEDFPSNFYLVRLCEIHTLGDEVKFNPVKTKKIETVRVKISRTTTRSLTELPNYTSRSIYAKRVYFSTQTTHQWLPVNGVLCWVNKTDFIHTMILARRLLKLPKLPKVLWAHIATFHKI